MLGEGVRRCRAAALVAAAAVSASLLFAVAAPPPARAGTPGWLSEVNRYRTAAGLNPVTDQPAWDRGLRHHLTYLEKTPGRYFSGQYQSFHTENPASPYYTADGAQEAANSDLDEGGAHSPLQAIDLWLAAPFHAVGMLRAQLTQIALADDPKAGFAGLDVLRGMDTSLPAATTPILFPGPGITTNLLTFGGESPDPLQTCGWPDGDTVGLPLIALLPQAPAASLTARLSGPGGASSTGAGTLCLVDEHTYRSSDPVYGATGAAILQGDNAVFLIPRRPLRTGRYTATIDQPGEPAVTWSFSAKAPRTSIHAARVRGDTLEVQITTPPGTLLRCALSARVGRGWAPSRFTRCWPTTVYSGLHRGRYRLSVRSAAGNASRTIRV